MSSGWKQSHIVHAFVKIQMEYYAAQDRAFLAYNTETPTAGYTLFNAGIGGGFTDKKGRTIFNVYLTGNNLFNVAYYDHLSRLKYFLYSPTDTNPVHGIYNMGRNISLKLDFPLDFSPETCQRPGSGRARMTAADPGKPPPVKKESAGYAIV